MKYVIDKNFQYSGVDYDYESYYPCSECPEICANDYCRCSTIENARVTEIDVDQILKAIGDFDETTTYCINRLLHINKVYDENKWEVEVSGGYYGEEVHGVKLECEKNLEEQIQTLMKIKTNRRKYEYVLEQEYGYLLEELKNKKWNIKTVKKESLVFGHKGHYTKLDIEAVNRYKKSGKDLPKCICIAHGDKYKVMDGYHRATAHDQEMIKIIVAS